MRRRRRWAPRECQLRELGGAGCFDGQLAGLFVERGRHGEDDGLPLEPQDVVARCLRRVPRVADVHQVARRRIDRRDVRSRSRFAQRQERRMSIDAGMRQPGLCRCHLPRRRQCTRSRASTPTMADGCGSHGSASVPLSVSSGSGEIQERRQHGPPPTIAGPVSCGMGTARRAVTPASIHGGDSGIGRAEIDPDQERVRAMSRGGALSDVQFQLPAIRALPAWHQSSSVPISVTRLSSVTGTRPWRKLRRRGPGRRQVTSSGPSSSRSSPSLR